MLRCAIIGSGYIIDDIHMPILRCLPQVEVAAVCDTNADRVAAFQARNKIGRSFGTLTELVANCDDIDFVDIAAPPHTHYELARQALESGLHVLVEKPLALCAEHGRDLDRTARRCGRKLCVVQNYRFRDPVLHARRAIDGGTIGRLRQISVLSHEDTTFETRAAWNWQTMGSDLLLYEVAVHYVDLELQFAGPARGLAGVRTARDPETGGVVQINALVEHDDGITAVLDFHILSASSFVQLDLFGSERDVEIKLFPESYRERRGQVLPQHDVEAGLRRLGNFAIPLLRERLSPPKVGRRRLPHFRVISGFVTSIEHPELDPPVTAASAVHTLDLLDALRARL